MSVMSAAEAREGAGASPEIPPPRLQIVTPATGQDDADEAAGRPLPGVGESVPSAQPATESALRVTQVRVIREVSVRTLRASRTGSPTTSQARMPSPGRVSSQAGGAQARVSSQARVSAQARVSSQARVAAQARVTGQAGAASQARVTAHSRVTSQARVTRQVRVAGPLPGRPGPVRLTRRGRRVVVGFVLGVVIVAATVLWMSVTGSVQASSRASAPGSAYRGMTQVVVQPGQTLWSIAAAAEPSGNLWAVVQQIINANALSGAQIQSGQLLWVPKN